MLLYEYSCDAYGKRFEICQSILDIYAYVYPECGGSGRRIFSGGSGFLIKNGVVESSIVAHCRKTQTCCGSSQPCEIPSCKKIISSRSL